MKLILKGHDARYAVEQSLLAFFPEERPVYEGEDGDSHAEVTLHEGNVYATGVTTLTYGGKTARGEARVRTAGVSDAYERERLRQRALKLSFFRAARDVTGVTPSWGALTGIRPAKLVRTMLEDGMTPAQADRVLRDTYCVSPARRRLALESAEAGLKAKRELKPNDISLYIGIPFCPTRCAYCSFVSASVEKSFALIPPYLEALMAEVNPLKHRMEAFSALKSRLEDIDAAIELAQEADDDDLGREAVEEFARWQKSLADFELLTLLNGPQDQASCYVTIHAGAGGTEACDWASMLLRMYIRWCERRGFSVTYLESTDGDDAGIRSVTLKEDGEYAYGYLKNERGIHRLVRISPFDSAGKRHTSFASLDATPEVSDSINIEILDKDLKVDTYRSGGKGGQNVNKVETAVRITHIPSGVIVACQNERSQLRNKEEAMNMLRAKLYQIEEDKKQAEADRQYSEKGDIGWGNQIRSYVLQPYTMVKDHRTNEETGNADSVLDGKIDIFINAYLKYVAQKGVK